MFDWTVRTFIILPLYYTLRLTVALGLKFCPDNWPEKKKALRRAMEMLC